MATPTYKAGSFASAHDGGSAPDVFTAYVMPALTNGYSLIVAASYAGAVTTVSQAGGSSWAQIGTATFPADYNVELWGVKNPTAVTGDITVSWGGTSAASAANIVNYEGVDQVTPIGTVQNANGTSATAALSATSVSGDLVYAAILNSFSGANGVTPNGGQTERGDDTDGATTINTEIQDLAASGVSTAMGGTLTSANWLVIGVALKGASGGGGPTVDQEAPAFAADMGGGIVGVNHWRTYGGNSRLETPLSARALEPLLELRPRVVQPMPHGGRHQHGRAAPWDGLRLQALVSALRQGP